MRMNSLKVREDGFEQLVDDEGISLQSNEVFRFKCCNCGLVHKMVIATEEQQEVGFAVRQESMDE
jgi:uncharacterized Zn finger protein